MNPVLLLTLTSSTKKQVIFVLATLAVIVALPCAAVFALGSNVLTLLSSVPSAAAAGTDGLYQGGLVEGNTYAWGNCTYWVFDLRQQAHEPIPLTWGDANTWANRAAADGYLVDNIPTPNAIMQTSAGVFGHVAYVTNVDATTGAWTISEMNVKGLDIVDTRTLPATAASSYSFIHNKDAL